MGQQHKAQKNLWCLFERTLEISNVKGQDQIFYSACQLGGALAAPQPVNYHLPQLGELFGTSLLLSDRSMPLTRFSV